jgi:hypothetical protein
MAKADLFRCYLSALPIDRRTTRSPEISLLAHLRESIAASTLKLTASKFEASSRSGATV